MRLRITTATETYEAQVTEVDDDEVSTVFRVVRGGEETFYEHLKNPGDSIDWGHLVCVAWALEALEGAEELED